MTATVTPLQFPTEAAGWLGYLDERADSGLAAARAAVATLRTVPPARPST